VVLQRGVDVGHAQAHVEQLGRHASPLTLGELGSWMQILPEVSVDERRQPVGIVTGAASGIGRATVESMCGHGWRIVAVDRTIAPLGDLAGHGLCAVEADITTEDGNAAAVAAAVDTFGALDAVVLNAGIHRAGPITDMPLTDVMDLISV